VGIVCAQEEKHNRYTEQELLGWCVLRPIVDLLPHVQVIIGAAVEVEWNAANPVEHDVRPEHIGYVGKSPRSLLRDARDNVPKNFKGDYQHDMDCPRPYLQHIRLIFVA